MSVNGIGNSSNLATSLYSGIAQLSGQSATSADGTAAGTVATSAGGQLTTALLQALAQLGINTNTANSSAAQTVGTGTAASQDQVASLVQSLAAALQSQNGTAAS